MEGLGNILNEQKKNYKKVTNHLKLYKLLEQIPGAVHSPVVKQVTDFASSKSYPSLQVISRVELTELEPFDKKPFATVGK